MRKLRDLSLQLRYLSQELKEQFTVEEIAHFLKSKYCVVVSDSCYQLERSNGSMRKLVHILSKGDPRFKFILFKDECDAYLRMAEPHQPLELERAFANLELSYPPEKYNGASLTVNISATLMPVLLKMARDEDGAPGEIFFTVVPKNMKLFEHSGVHHFQPMVQAASTDTEPAGATKSNSQILVRLNSCDSNLENLDDAAVDNNDKRVFLNEQLTAEWYRQGWL